MTNKYKVTKLFEKQLRSETETYILEVSVDSLSQTNLTFGSSFSLRLDYDELSLLGTIIKECQGFIENEVIDSANQTQLPFNDKEDSAYQTPDVTHYNDVVDW